MAKNESANKPAAVADEEHAPSSPQVPAVVSASASPAESAPPAAPVVREPVAQGLLPVTAISNLAAALAKITAAIGDNPVVKAGTNSFHGYKYARMQDILGTLTPMIAAEGVTIMQSESKRGFIDNGAAVYVEYEFTIIHKSGEVWPQKQTATGLCRARDSKGGFDDKCFNKCHTAARKYFLLALFQIPTEDEDDADRGDNDTRRQPDRPAPEARQPEPEPVEKAAPHPIKFGPGTANASLAVWTGVFIAQINHCDKLQDVVEYQRLNEVPLGMVAEKSAKLDTKIQDTLVARKDELAARA